MGSYVRAEKPLLNPQTASANYSKYNSTGEDARGKLLSGVGDIEGGSDRLRDSQAKVLETEEIGNEVLSHLQRQRETVSGTTKTFDEMEDSHTEMDSVLRNMGFNAITNKYLCYFVIFLVICTLVMVFILSLGS